MGSEEPRWCCCASGAGGEGGELPKLSNAMCCINKLDTLAGSYDSMFVLKKKKKNRSRENSYFKLITNALSPLHSFLYTSHFACTPLPFSASSPPRSLSYCGRSPRSCWALIRSRYPSCFPPLLGYSAPHEGASDGSWEGPAAPQPQELLGSSSQPQDVVVVVVVTVLQQPCVQVGGDTGAATGVS